LTDVGADPVVPVPKAQAFFSLIIKKVNPKIEMNLFVFSA
jgi:hypothetical protein